MTLGDGIQIVTLLDPWVKRPVFHRRLNVWTDDPAPDPLNVRGRFDIPEGYRLTFKRTGCGIILSAYWWDPSQGIDDQGEYVRPFTTIDLRQDHAEHFARPCRRCYPR